MVKYERRASRRQQNFKARAELSADSCVLKCTALGFHAEEMFFAGVSANNSTENQWHEELTKFHNIVTVKPGHFMKHPNDVITLSFN